jgi:hypothetical protein
MLHGLLMELDDRNCWTIAEAAGHRGPHRLQHLLSRAVWDDQQVLDIASAWAVSHLDDGDAVLVPQDLRPDRCRVIVPWSAAAEDVVATTSSGAASFLRPAAGRWRLARG